MPKTEPGGLPSQATQTTMARYFAEAAEFLEASWDRYLRSGPSSQNPTYRDWIKRVERFDEILGSELDDTESRDQKRHQGRVRASLARMRARQRET
jgi:hypothetical protein